MKNLYQTMSDYFKNNKRKIEMNGVYISEGIYY